MKKIVFSMLFLILMLSQIALALPTNILPNPSFEAGDFGGWHAWYYSGGATINMRDNSSSLFGDHSATIASCTGNVVIVRDHIPIDSSKSYTISGWIKTDFNSSDVKARLRLLFYSDGEYTGEAAATRFIEEAGDWTFVELVIPADTIPKRANHVSFACNVMGTPTSQGKAYFDGLCLAEGTNLERPTAPTITSHHKNGNIKLSWETTDPTVKQFLLFEGKGPDFTAGTHVITIKEQEYQFHDPSKKASFFRVGALNQNFIPSDFSQSVKGDPYPPKAIETMEIDDRETGVVIVKWQVPEAADDGDLPVRYNLYRLKNEEFTTGNIVGKLELNSTDPEFKRDPGTWIEVWYPAPGNVIYYYTVTAFDESDNETKPQLFLEACPEADQVPPLSPVGAAAYTDRDQEQNPIPKGVVELRWEEPIEAAADGDHPRFYRLYRAVGSKANSQLFAEIRAVGPGEAHAYKDTTATQGGIYLYWIRSVDKAGNESEAGEWLEVALQKPEVAILLAPEQGSGVVDKQEVVTFSWQAPPEELDRVSGYKVEFAANSSFSTIYFEENSYLEAGTELRSQLPLDRFQNGIYYWRVKTEYESGVVAYTQGRKLTVIKSGFANSLAGLIAFVQIEPQVLRTKAEPARINLVMKTDAVLTIRVFGSNGKEVNTLLQNQFVAGQELMTLTWDGMDVRGSSVCDGLYFVQFHATFPGEDDTTVVKRVQVFR